MRCPEQPDGPTVVVIDDVHLLADESRELLAAILTADPDSVRLLLIGRHEPDLVPISAALTGAVRALRVDDLRFDETEAADLVRVAPPDRRARTTWPPCSSRPTGWAAALVLGSRALAGSANVADARASLAATRQPVLDYLLHEVFESLPADLTQVLLTTCQQAQVNADEAVLLSGLPRRARAPGPGGGRRAPGDRLPRRSGSRVGGMALPPAAPRPAAPTYRARPDRTGRSSSPRTTARPRRTSTGATPSEAIRHAGLTGDLDLQLRVLREFGSELISQRRIEVLGAVLAAIPLDIRSRHPDLLVVQAMLLRAQGRIDAAKAATDRVLAIDARSLREPVPRDTEAQLALLEVWQARYGWREAGPALDRAARVLGCRHDAEVSAHDLPGLSPVTAAWLTLEMAYFQTWLGDLDLAAIHVQDVAMYAQQVDLPAADPVEPRRPGGARDGRRRLPERAGDRRRRPRWSTPTPAPTPPARASTSPAGGRCCRSSGSPRRRRRSPGSTRPRAG